MEIINNNYHSNIDNNGIIVAKNNHRSSTSSTKDETYDDFQENNNANIDKIIDNLNDNVKTFNNGLEFSYNTDEKRFHVILKDKSTGDIIQEYPKEEISKISNRLDNILGSVFDQQG